MLLLKNNQDLSNWSFTYSWTQLPKDKFIMIFCLCFSRWLARTRTWGPPRPRSSGTSTSGLTQSSSQGRSSTRSWKTPRPGLSSLNLSSRQRLPQSLPRGSPPSWPSLPALGRRWLPGQSRSSRSCPPVGCWLAAERPNLIRASFDCNLFVKKIIEIFSGIVKSIYVSVPGVTPPP